MSTSRNSEWSEEPGQTETGAKEDAKPAPFKWNITPGAESWTHDPLVISSLSDPSIIDGLLREREVGSIVGAAKTSKTWFALSLALKVATGEPFLGMETHRRKVLYLDYELKPATLRKRMSMLAADKPETATYGVTQEQANRYGLPCGGTLQLVFEPVSEDSRREELLATIERHEMVARSLDMKTGKVNLEAGKWSDNLEFDGAVLKTVHGPSWRLLVIGAGQVSRYIAQMAQALDYHVTVCDPREEYAEEWNFPGVPLNRGYPDDVVIEMNMDAHSAVVALTHDPKLDDAALIEALKSPAFYVGALGSK